MHPFDLKYSIKGLAFSNQLSFVGAENQRTIIAGRLENSYPLLNSGPRIPCIVRRIDTREECDVHTEGLLCTLSSFSNGLAQSVRAWLREGRKDT
jgi:hypothetical protein